MFHILCTEKKIKIKKIKSYLPTYPNFSEHVASNTHTHTHTHTHTRTHTYTYTCVTSFRNLNKKNA